jgi:hypothetical protein
MVYPPLSGKMTQFIIGSIVAANAALTVLRFQKDSMIGDLFLSEDKGAFISQ